MTMPKNISLSQQLADALPESEQFHFYHISTPPTKCAAIFSAPQGEKPERTYRESHFLTVSIRPENETEAAEILVLAIEVMIYTTKTLTTLFVSKADSTGYLSLLSIPRGHVSPLRLITTTFISYLVQNRQRPDVRLVVSLFARASDQYLFPGSVENTAKHISDDRQLIKWWCRVLDPVLRGYIAEDEQISGDNQEGGITSQAYLIAPGEDSIVSFLPQEVRFDPSLRKRWKYGHPLREISSIPAAPPRCLIPHFPDDPKARFLNELDDELPDATGSVTESPSKRGNGQWNSVKSLEQFWEMMAYRQECSSGRLVGFLWVVFTPPDWEPLTTESQSDSQASSALFNSTNTFESLTTSSSPSLKPTSPRKPPAQRRKLSGIIKPRMPRIKSASSNLSTTSQPEQSPYYLWPIESRGDIVLDERKYSKATETLLRLDFASQSLAKDSTKTWVDEVAVLAGLSDAWGQTVTGRHTLPIDAARHNGGAANIIQPAKKRKVDSQDTESVMQTSGGVQTLSAGLMRKKPRSDEEPSTSVETQSTVNVLGFNSVRKKLKVQPEPVPVASVRAEEGINMLDGGLVRKKPRGS